jgi:uncharacterized protein (TIGR03083 family)
MAVAITALEQEIQYAKELFATLRPEEWQSASMCEGWRVQDLAQHMAAVFQQIADSSSIDVGDSGHAEVANEVPVQARRDWSVDQVVEAYNEWAPKGLGALAALQEPPMADMAVPISDLGTHPLRLLGNAIAFDHYCHLRYDIPIDRAAELPRDPATLGVVLEWMLAGLPQMCAEALAGAPAQPVNLVFDGPGGGAYVLAPGDDGWVVTEGSDAGAPTVTTTVHDFVSWGTKRSDWRDSVTGDVDHDGVAAVLDAVNII